MSVELIGDLILLCGIVSGGILLAVVNANYIPDDDEKK